MTTSAIQNLDKTEYSFNETLNGLPMLRADIHRLSFGRHMHEGFCIGIIEAGSERFFRNGANHVATKNKIVLVNPEQVHDGQAATENGLKYRAIYPLVELLQEAQQAFNGQMTTPWFDTPVVEDAAMATQLLNLFDHFDHCNNTLAVETHFLLAMINLLHRHSRGFDDVATPGRENQHISQLQQYIRDNLSENLATDELSHLVQLNPSYLIRAFQKAVGMPPHAWQNQQRVIKAQQLLRQGMKATRVAQEVGFNDQSHLNRFFVKSYGTSPKRYQKALGI